MFVQIVEGATSFKVQSRCRSYPQIVPFPCHSPIGLIDVSSSLLQNIFSNFSCSTFSKKKLFNDLRTAVLSLKQPSTKSLYHLDIDSSEMLLLH